MLQDAVSHDAIAALEDQRAGLWEAITELDCCVQAELPGDPGDGWHGPARDAYCELLSQLRANVWHVRDALIDAHRLTVAALKAATSGD